MSHHLSPSENNNLFNFRLPGKAFSPRISPVNITVQMKIILSDELYPHMYFGRCLGIHVNSESRTGFRWNTKLLKDPNIYSNFTLFFIFMIMSFPWVKFLKILHLSCIKTSFNKLHPSWCSLFSGNICPLVLALPFSLAWIYRVRNPCSSIQSSFSHNTNSLKVVHFFSLHHLWKLYQIVMKCECATLSASFGEG